MPPGAFRAVPPKAPYGWAYCKKVCVKGVWIMALLQVNLLSETLMRTVPVQVILPVDKITLPGMAPREEKPYKTLYLLHGIFGNYTDWVTGTALPAGRKKKTWRWSCPPEIICFISISRIATIITENLSDVSWWS